MNDKNVYQPKFQRVEIPIKQLFAHPIPLYWESPTVVCLLVEAPLTELKRYFFYPSSLAVFETFSEK